MWNFLTRMRPHDGQYNRWVHVSVPGNGITIDKAFDLIRGLVETHEALRTSYHQSESGTPMQHVRGEGSAQVAVLHESVARQYVTGARARSHELRQIPCEFLVPHREGRVRAIQLSTSHLTADGWSAAVLRRQIYQRLVGTFRPPPGPVRQPADQAAWEASPVGRLANQTGLAFWREMLRLVPDERFAVVSPSSSPRYRQIQVSSTAAGRRVRQLARTRGALLSAVPLAAFSAALAGQLGSQRNAFWIVVHNRFGPELAPAVGCYFREVLICLPGSQDRAAQHPMQVVSNALLRAFRNSQTDPRDVLNILEDTGHGSYFSHARAFYYNFTESGPSSTTSGADPEFAESPVEWVASKEVDGQLMYLNADLAGDRLTLRLMADTWCFPVDMVEQTLLSCLEEILRRVPG
jgi:hypothetical protein